MVGPSCKLFVSLCENGDLFKDCYPFNLSWFVSLSRWLERRDGEMERMRWRLTKPACVPVITQSPLFVCLFLGWPKRGGGRGEVKKLACYPVNPPRHTVPPAQVEPADPKEKGGRGFTRGQDASSPNPTQLCRL